MCADLKKMFDPSFVSKIQEPEKDDDLSKLFGGKIKKLVKSKAKELRDVSSLSKVSRFGQRRRPSRSFSARQAGCLSRLDLVFLPHLR